MNRLALVLAVGTLCSVCFAQQGEVAGGSTAPAGDGKKFFDVELGLNADYAFRSDLDTGGGDVAVTRSMLSLWLGHSFSGTFRGTLTMTSEYSWYDFSGAPTLIPGTTNPFSQFSESDITLGGQYKLNPEWTAVGGVFFRWAGENDVDLSDAFTWGGYAAGRYQPNKDFSITLGVRVNTRLEESTLVLPAIAMDWSVTDTVKLQIIPAVGGTGVRVSSKINEQWAFLIDGEYQARAYRMDNIAPLPNGVVRDERIQVGLGVIWTPKPSITVTARAGVVAWQEFDIDNSSGGQVSQSNTDPTPYLFLGGTITF